jgi:hypothetical protein
VAGAAKSSFAGVQLRVAAAPRAVARRFLAPIAELERLRLHNLTPTPGSRPAKKRVGRGHSAGQVRGVLPPTHGRVLPPTHGRASRRRRGAPHHAALARRTPHAARSAARLAPPVALRAASWRGASEP